MQKQVLQAITSQLVEAPKLPTYAQLDAVADALNPALLIVTLALPALPIDQTPSLPMFIRRYLRVLPKNFSL